MPGPIMCTQESHVDPVLGRSHSWMLWASAQVTLMTEPGSLLSPCPEPIIGEGQLEQSCSAHSTEFQEMESHGSSVSLILSCVP